MDVDQMIERLERLDVADIVNTTLLKNKGKAEDILRKQHKQGNSATGKIGKYRPPTGNYAQFKNRMNPDAGLGNVDLYLTGSFSDKIKASVTSDELVFTDTDTKTSNLVEKYSSSILDLNGQNVSNLAEDIEDDFHKVITQITGLEFR